MCKHSSNLRRIFLGPNYFFLSIEESLSSQTLISIFTLQFQSRKLDILIAVCTVVSWLFLLLTLFNWVFWNTPPVEVSTVGSGGSGSWLQHVGGQKADWQLALLVNGPHPLEMTKLHNFWNFLFVSHKSWIIPESLSCLFWRLPPGFRQEHINKNKAKEAYRSVYKKWHKETKLGRNVSVSFGHHKPTNIWSHICHCVSPSTWPATSNGLSTNVIVRWTLNIPDW